MTNFGDFRILIGILLVCHYVICVVSGRAIRIQYRKLSLFQFVLIVCSGGLAAFGAIIVSREHILQIVFGCIALSITFSTCFLVWAVYVLLTKKAQDRLIGMLHHIGLSRSSSPVSPRNKHNNMITSNNPSFLHSEHPEARLPTTEELK